MTKVKEINRPVPEMCTGCARNLIDTCVIITEPKYIYKHRRSCFAKIDAARAWEIEKEINIISGSRMR